VVEDHDDSAMAMAMILRSFGHRVQTADSCATARKLFQMNRDVDVLLVDLGLPDGDGCDLPRELLAIKTVPAIAVTGYSMTQDIERSRAAGFTAYITKPLLVPDLTPASKQAAESAVRGSVRVSWRWIACAASNGSPGN
jgi:CheY-like chemotaxis protein